MAFKEDVIKIGQSFVPMEMKNGEPIPSTGFTLDYDGAWFYQEILDWLDGDERKGLFVQGSMGTGKSLAIKVMAKLTKRIKVYKCRNIVIDFNREGWGILDKFNGRNSDTFRKNEMIQCFDDLGNEMSMVKSFGTPVNVMAEVLYEKYEQYQEGGVRSIVTTNLTSDKLTALYGERLIDRFKEMYRFVKLTGNSLRK